MILVFGVFNVMVTYRATYVWCVVAFVDVYLNVYNLVYFYAYMYHICFNVGVSCAYDTTKIETPRISPTTIDTCWC